MSAPARPRPVDLAVKLMLGLALLSLVGGVVTLALGDQVQQQVAADPALDAEAAGAFAAVGLAVAVAISLIGALLWVLIAVFSARGQNWARTLGTVVAALLVLGGLVGLLGVAVTGLDLTAVLNLVQLGLAAAVVWFLFRPESNAFFRSSGAAVA